MDGASVYPFGDLRILGTNDHDALVAGTAIESAYDRTTREGLLLYTALELAV